MTVRPGRRARVCGLCASDVQHRPRRVRWQTIAEALERDVLQAAPWLESELSSTKRLCARFGVSYRTMRRALESLSDQKLVRRHLRGYVATAPRPVSAGGTVVLIARGNQPNRLVMMPPRGDVYIRALDAQCAHAGIRAMVSPHWFVGRDSVAGAVDWTDRENRLARQHTILGFVVIPTGLPPLDDWLLPRLTALDLPTVVIDEAPPAASPKTGYRANLLWVAAVDSYAAGVAMGRYLYGLGHRRVAYFCPFSNRDWSFPRLLGMQSVFEAAGESEGVVPFLGVAREGDRATPPDLRDAIAERLVETAVQGALTNAEAVRGSFRAFCERMVEPVHGSIGWAAGESLPAAVTLYGLASKALHAPGVTAWVGSNAMTALILDDFLTSRHVRIPDMMSVVGFDDTSLTATRRLTTYSFNPQAAVTLAMHHILSPAPLRKPGPCRTVRVEGYVNARASASPPVRCNGV